MKKDIFLQRFCPVCGNMTAEYMYSVRFTPIDNEYLPNNFTVVACNKCGFIFDEMTSSQEYFDLYYNSTLKYQRLGAYGSGGNSSDDLVRYENLYNFLHKYITPEAKILDIGAGQCGFLRFLSSKGFTHLTAIEPSIKGNRHNIIQVYHSIDDIRERERERERERGKEGAHYDVIICMQVLEHIFDIHSFLKKVLSLSHKKTLFYIEVPDANNYLRSYRAPFHLFDREHINHFTLTSLKNIFIQYGLVSFKDYEFYHVYSNIGCIFAYGGKKAITKDISGQIAIQKYITFSEKNDTLEHLRGVRTPVILWGLGAYLRRIYLKDDFPKNIVAIIDKSQGNLGKYWNNIPITTGAILKEKRYQNCTLIVTSALYAEEIKKEITEMNFQGTVLTAF